MQSTGKKFRMTNQSNISSTNEKQIRYKHKDDMLPSDHPNEDYNWLSNIDDFNKLANG